MKRTKIALALILSAIITLSGCGSRSNTDVNALKEQIKELQSQLEEKENEPKDTEWEDVDYLDEEDYWDEEYEEEYEEVIPETIVYTLPENPESDFNYRIEDGIAYITKYNGTSTEVRVPEKIDGLEVMLGNNTFQGNDKITKIELPSGSITEISRVTFYGCTNVTSITLPDGVTKKKFKES